MKRSGFFLFGFLMFCCCLARGAEPERELVIEPLTPQGKISYQFDSGLAIATGGVRIRYGDTELTAGRVSANLQSGQVFAEGDIHLWQGKQMWRAEQMEYNFKTRALRCGPFRTGMSPYFAGAKEAAGTQSNQVYTATGGYITTDDVNRPFYRVEVRSLRVIPGQSIEGRDAVVYIGSIPIMYFPYYHRTLKRHPNNFRVLPGYRTLFGPYLLSAYDWYLSTNLNGSVNADYREKKGFGAGPDVNFDAGAFGHGTLSAYGTRDRTPGTNLLGGEIPNDRQRIKFVYEAELRTNFTVKAAANEQSDPDMLVDFFESQYDKNPQPKSFLEVNPYWSNWSLNVLAEPQLNDFFQTVERLPDVKLSGLRQQLGVSPFYYESETSAGYFRFEPGETVGTNYTAMRGDTFHQILLPMNFFGWLNVTPRVGGRFTRYEETEGLEGVKSDINRGVFNTGAEFSFKASRTWAGSESSWLDVNGLRHIIEPSFNYVFVPRPSAEPAELPQFDTEIPSYRPLPIVFPDYNAIDSIDSQNALRLSLFNKLQTKRQGRLDNVVNWALIADWRLSRMPGQGPFSDLYSYLDFKPRSWLVFNSETRLDPHAWSLHLANHSLTIMPNDVWSVSVGHRYFRPDATEMPLLFYNPAFNAGNNLFFTRFYYKLNENWAVRVSHVFDAGDGVLEQQYYTIYRDFRSWTGAFTLRVLDNIFGQQDLTAAFSFSLKAFPRYKQDREEPAYLLGG